MYKRPLSWSRPGQLRQVCRHGRAGNPLQEAGAPTGCGEATLGHLRQYSTRPNRLERDRGAPRAHSRQLPRADSDAQHGGGRSAAGVADVSQATSGSGQSGSLTKRFEAEAQPRAAAGLGRPAAAWGTGTSAGQRPSDIGRGGLR
jgi:hypothetical protein